MDKQLDRAIMQFYSDIRDNTTDELYEEYLEQCKADKVEPRSKSVIIREACAATNCVLEEKRIIVKYFKARKR